ncbi:MAG: acyl-CoA synthetase [Hyphomicrobiaceae bacterium]
MTVPTKQSSGIISGERRLATDVFEARILRAATALERLGAGPGQSVAILMRNDIPFLEASLAAQRIGAYAVPVNWHFHPEEVAYVLADCDARVVVGHDDLLGALAGRLPGGARVVSVAVPPEIAATYNVQTSVARLPGALDWEDLLAGSEPYGGPIVPQTMSMIYTSGTTGHPKGVRRQPPTPEQLKGLDAQRRLINGLEPGVRAMLPGPLYHSAPNSFALRAARIADALVLMPRFEPEVFLAEVERHRITTLFMVPVMFVRLLKLPEEVRRRYDVSSLKFVMHAAAPCPPDVKRQMIEWFGPIVWEFYGATEIGAITVISSEEWMARPGSVGRVTPGTDLRIYGDDGREVAQGEVGEVYARVGCYPEFTYNKLPDKRAEVEREGLITVGDMGYLDGDGFLYLCDRKRDMVISGGVNIYPAEIEATAIGMPGVKDCAVFGVPDEEFGEALMMLVEPQDGHTLAPEDVRRYLAEHLARYKVPQTIEVRIGLPREDSGKIFKRRLREPYWERAGRRI